MNGCGEDDGGGGRRGGCVVGLNSFLRGGGWHTLPL